MHTAYGGQGPGVIALAGTLAGIASMLMLARIYVRYALSPHGGWALFWACCTWVATSVTLCFTILAVVHGVGNEMEAVEAAGMDNLSNFLLFTWVTITSFEVGIVLGKIAVSAFLLEIIGFTNRVQRYILHFITFSNVLIVIPELFLLWFQCRPVTALWNPLEQNRCDFPRNNKFAIFQGVWLALSDLVQATIPLFIIWPLQMPRRTKFGLSLLMSLGYFAAGSTIARTYAIKTLSEPDLSHATAQLFMWAKAEEWLVLIASSVPPAAPAFKQFYQRVRAHCAFGLQPIGAGLGQHGDHRHGSSAKDLVMKPKRNDSEESQDSSVGSAGSESKSEGDYERNPRVELERSGYAHAGRVL